VTPARESVALMPDSHIGRSGNWGFRPQECPEGEGVQALNAAIYAGMIASFGLNSPVLTMPKIGSLMLRS
jgi:hypothetical protein